MASLKLTIIYLAVNLLAIFKCELSGPYHHLYTQAKFPLKIPGYGAVRYIPVCRPDCFTPSDHQPQIHLPSNCAEKANIGNLPLQHHVQNYPSEVNVASHQQSDYSHQSHYSGDASSQNYHLASDSSSQKSHLGSATAYQQNTGHKSEQKHSIHHHGSGVSHQVFKQEHQQGHTNGFSSEVQDQGYEDSENSHHHHQKDHNVNYQFEYSVHDQKTGDVKRHKEERKGDVVNGEYSLLEEDGNVRTVKYYADWKSGFHAQVHNSKPKSSG